MDSYRLTVFGANEAWHQIRWELFAFPQIRDVQPSDDPNQVDIAHTGAPRPEAWCRQLAEAGFAVRFPSSVVESVKAA